jgi:hypothetical protein
MSQVRHKNEPAILPVTETAQLSGKYNRPAIGPPVPEGRRTLAGGAKPPDTARPLNLPSCQNYQLSNLWISAVFLGPDFFMQIAS